MKPIDIPLFKSNKTETVLLAKSIEMLDKNTDNKSMKAALSFFLIPLNFVLFNLKKNGFSFYFVIFSLTNYISIGKQKCTINIAKSLVHQKKPDNFCFFHQGKTVIMTLAKKQLTKATFYAIILIVHKVNDILQKRRIGMEEALREQILEAWVGMTCMIKNSRLTEGLTYNEAILMMFAYQNHRVDGMGEISVGALLRKTNMLKSQISRTVESLTEKGLIEKMRGEEDGRTLQLKISSKGMAVFTPIHNRSLAMVDRVLALIGTEDAEAFVRIYQQLSSAELSLSKNNS